MSNSASGRVAERPTLSSIRQRILDECYFRRRRVHFGGEQRTGIASQSVQACVLDTWQKSHFGTFAFLIGGCKMEWTDENCSFLMQMATRSTSAWDKHERHRRFVDGVLFVRGLWEPRNDALGYFSPLTNDEDRVLTIFCRRSSKACTGIAAKFSPVRRRGETESPCTSRSPTTSM